MDEYFGTEQIGTSGRNHHMIRDPVPRDNLRIKKRKLEQFLHFPIS